MTDQQATPIPPRLVEEFKGWMDAAYNDDDAPDGAWFQRLEDDAAAFMKQHRIKGCSNDAAHQALTLLGPQS